MESVHFHGVQASRQRDPDRHRSCAQTRRHAASPVRCAIPEQAREVRLAQCAIPAWRRSTGTPPPATWRQRGHRQGKALAAQDRPPPPSCGTGDRCARQTCFRLRRAVVDYALAGRRIAKSLPPGRPAHGPALRWYRGRSLAEFDERTRHNIRTCRSIEGLDLDLDAALAVWTHALEVPGAHEASSDRWYHSDLVAENLLVTDGRLTGVVDFDGLAVGDPTVDRHGAWEVLDPPAREVFRTRLKVDEAEWLRGRAWALAIALGTFTYYWATMPGRRRDRLAMAKSVLDDAFEGCA
jgi:hypothetical protein